MFPFDTSTRLSRLLEGVSRALLAERAARMSDQYRRGRGSGEAIRDDLDALAYAVARMPATFAAVSAALGHARRHLPELAPRSLLDLGAGPGTGAIAARQVWPELEHATLIEHNPRMRGLAADLVAAAWDDRFVIDPGDLGRRVVAEPADLVIAAYVAVELSLETSAKLVTQAFGLARQALVLVEPGTPAGFDRLRHLRSALLAAGAVIAAPCPGPLPCPMAGSDWCHFSVRLARSRDHKLVKGADVPFEDERFCYLVVARTGDAVRSATARLLAEPRVDRGAVTLRLCTPDGLGARVASRTDKAGFKAARKLDWGDALES